MASVITLPLPSGLRDPLRPLLPIAVSMALPAANLVFLATGPHAWDVALIWTLPVWLLIYADLKGPAAKSEPMDSAGRWIDSSLYLLFCLQLANILLMLLMASRLSWSSWTDFLTSACNIAAMRIMTGTNSCCSGIALAHELIHRRAVHRRWMGRILLWTVCYDHFMVEHLLGHHRRASTPDDPATARFGESYRAFWRRSLPQQFSSAWRLETRRIRSLGAGFWRHRVLQGLLIQALLLVSIAYGFGLVALLMFLYQALVAVHLLETVNYFQHWGLTRGGRYFSGADAWSTDAWMTTHAFVGLSRHADHHTHATKPFQQLRSHTDSPRLPHGYFVMAVTVKLFNKHYRRMAEQELRRRALGPHRGAEARTCLIDASSSNFAA